MDAAAKIRLDVLKTASKKLFAEATGEFIGKKLLIKL